MQTRRERWVLYGASGYTGQLIAEEALRRGHRPLLAGRSEAKLRPLAERLGLEWAAVPLEDEAALRRLLEGAGAVLHAAGPFIHTSAPMLRACLAAGVHYLDITGEIPVFAHTFSLDTQARTRGVALISGVGFDVVPTDCLAVYVAGRVPGATELELAFASLGRASAGTTRSALEQLPKGGQVRRQGQLMSWPLGQGARTVRFSDRERTVLPIPWGDLETAWHSTGIPNITTYMALPPRAVQAIRWGFPLVRRLLSVDAVRKQALALVEKRVHGPDAEEREQGRSLVWARVSARDGRQAEAWLETVDGYVFTALAGVRAVEEVVARSPRGALTPAQAFGPDFVLGIEGTRRLDRLG